MFLSFEGFKNVCIVITVNYIFPLIIRIPTSKTIEYSSFNAGTHSSEVNHASDDSSSQANIPKKSHICSLFPLALFLIGVSISLLFKRDQINLAALFRKREVEGFFGP